MKRYSLGIYRYKLKTKQKHENGNIYEAKSQVGQINADFMNVQFMLQGALRSQICHYPEFILF